MGTRRTFIGGACIGVVALVASACSGLMGSPQRASARPTAPAPPPLAEIYRAERLEGEPTMRVRVGTKMTDTTIGGPERVTVTPPGLSPEVLILRTPLEVRRTRGLWSVTSEGRTTKITDAPNTDPESVNTLTVRSLGAELLTLDDAPLPGDLAFKPEEQGVTFDAVEYVNLEAYLPGVIAKELYPNWSLETFKAQAVAARSYALHERARRRGIGSHFDVVSTTQDQAYGGATKHTVAHEAVRDTAGVVLTWSGEILRSYYSSTVGGRAASASDTWPVGKGFEFNFAAPIQATTRGDEDKISPRYRWSVERTVSDVTARLRAFGADRKNALRNFGTVRSIEVERRNGFERPVRFRVTDHRGKSYSMRAEDLRVALNTVAPGLKKVDAKTRVYSSDISAAITGDRVTITGRGFGHGVGMSQFGAEALARDGWDASRILLYYYAGAELERAY